MKAIVQHAAKPSQPALDTAEAIRHLAEQHARTKIVIAARGCHAAP